MNWKHSYSKFVKDNEMNMLVRVRIDYSEIYLKILFILIDLEEGWDEGTGSL